MAKEPASIPKEPLVPDSQNYALLKREGLERIEALGSDIWTDYNQHDPGITILEQLCYALTELAYKSNMSMDDLLYAERKERFDPKDNAFFAADKVFPCSPLSIMDYRRLLIDQLYPEVKNAWLVPLESGAFGVNMSGLFQVNLQLNENSPEKRQSARESAFRLLNRNRNLCEDFEQVRVLNPLQIAVKVEVTIDPKAHAEQVISEILHQLSLTLSPQTRFRTLDELQARGLNFEQIFDGPPPKHGFVDVDSLVASGLKPVWSVQNPARLVALLRDLKGVERVSQLEVGVFFKGKTLPEGFRLIERLKGDEEFDGYYLTSTEKKLPRGHKEKKLKNPAKELPIGLYNLREDDPIPDGFYPQLDVESMMTNRTIKCNIEGLGYEYDADSVLKNYQRLQAEQLTQYQHELEFPEPKGSSKRSIEELVNYSSIQENFPEIYGIGSFGVSKSRPLEWQKHARNLKGYLFFFEQIMADYLAQLTNFYQLFSLKDEVPRTYFHQVPRIPWEEWLLKPGQTVDDLQAALERIGSSFDPIADRRNRALDHLLARFGEEFLSDAYNAITRNAIEETQQKFENELIKAKLRFLANITELGRDRGRGLDYMSYAGGQEASDYVTHNMALQKRLALLFNMKDHQQVSLSESIREADGVSFGKKQKAKADNKAAFSFTAKHKDVLSTVMNDGLSRDAFVIEENPKKKGEFQIFFTALAGKGAKDPVFTATSVEKCETALTALVKRVRELNAASEGFHLVEHVLLRPVGEVMYTWYLVREGRIFLETPVMENMAFEKEFKALLQSRAMDAENYITTGTPDEGFTLVLTGDDGSVIAYKEGYIDETSAERERDRIIMLIPQIDDADSGLVIRKEQHIPKGALLSDDFFSMQLSVVLPAWPVRFRNDKFRALFEQVVKLNVAAHTHVATYWIDLSEMADFEKIFLEWRTEKAKLQPKQPWLDELSWCLVILLKFFADANDPLVIKELPALRDKHGLTMKFGDEGS
jgi:hypothetical protein